MSEELIQRLLNSEEPIIRYKAAVYLSGCDPEGMEAARLRAEVRQSPRVQKMLAVRSEDGKFSADAYHKWTGAHWILSILADCGFPPDDEVVDALFEPEYRWLFSERHLKSIRIFDGRVRRCMSQEGNALFAAVKLRRIDEQAHELAGRIIEWQWPDGGWNCDKRPEAHVSSFHESLIPLRAIGWYARETGDARAQLCADRAVEFFLRRQLYKRATTGEVIEQRMVELHYPPFWHYDYLAGLKVMKELGRIDDPRCKTALELLASQRLADGGFPVEARWYRTTNPNPKVSGYSMVEWGTTGKTRMNEFVTVDALYVLGEKTAGN